MRVSACSSLVGRSLTPDSEKILMEGNARTCLLGKSHYSRVTELHALRFFPDVEKRSRPMGENIIRAKWNCFTVHSLLVTSTSEHIGGNLIFLPEPTVNKGLRIAIFALRRFVEPRTNSRDRAKLSRNRVFEIVKEFVIYLRDHEYRRLYHWEC